MSYLTPILFRCQKRKRLRKILRWPEGLLTRNWKRVKELYVNLIGMAMDELRGIKKIARIIEKSFGRGPGT